MRTRARLKSEDFKTKICMNQTKFLGSGEKNYPPMTILSIKSTLFKGQGPKNVRNPACAPPPLHNQKLSLDLKILPPYIMPGCLVQCIFCPKTVIVDGWCCVWGGIHTGGHIVFKYLNICPATIFSRTLLNEDNTLMGL